jgi:hypothetical protein
VLVAGVDVLVTAVTLLGAGSGAGAAAGASVGAALAVLVGAGGAGALAGTAACAVESDSIAAPPEPVLVATLAVVELAAVSRATCTEEVVLATHARPVGCCLSSELITASIFDPAPILPGG